MKEIQVFNHQQSLLTKDPKKTGIFWSTGGGKTRVALLLARGSTLVIAPKLQRDDGNWEREYKALGLSFPLTIISKETFRRDHKELPPFDTVILEECHTLAGVAPSVRWRNKKPIPRASQLFEATMEYLERTKPKRLYLLTATPTRSPMGVWALAQFLGITWDFYKFRDAFYTKLPIPGREIWKVRNSTETKERLAKSVRLLGEVGRLEDWVDVPEQTFKTEYIPMNKMQIEESKKARIEYPNPLVLVGKQHQVENLYESGKIERIIEYAEEFDKLLIFAKYIAQIEEIEAALIKEGKKVIVLTGNTKDKGEAIREAREASQCIVICQSQISTGFELPDYPCTLYASLSWSVTDLIQSQGRIHRINALKKNLYVYLVTKGGVDQDVYKAVVIEKQDYHERIYEKKGSSVYSTVSKVA